MLKDGRVHGSHSLFTVEDVQKLVDKTPIEVYTHGTYSHGDFMPKDSSDLVGKHFEMVFDDGLQLTYDFLETNKLCWSDGKTSQEDFVQVYNSSVENVYLFFHHIKGSVPPTARMIVMDLDNGLVTATVAGLCRTKHPSDVVREFHFGLIKGYEDPGYRHSFTTDMVGKAISWTYRDPQIIIKHIYTSPRYYTVTNKIKGRDGEDIYICASNMADYIKIREGLYIFTLVEEGMAGVQLFFLMDLYKLHDVGCWYGVNAGGLRCYGVGARGKWAPMYTLDDGSLITKHFDWEKEL